MTNNASISRKAKAVGKIKRSLLLMLAAVSTGMPRTVLAADPVTSRPAQDLPAVETETKHGDAREARIAKPSLTNGNELMLFEDMPIVVSASRQAQPINQSAVPVSIITADTIHFSGATNIPDLLNNVPGVDVTKIDRNNYSIGVRGLNHSLADRTLTLVNGRNAGSPSLGNSDFLAMPIMLEDIDRIEVVRGPGGAVWGANAFNGVINVITKRPEDTTGVLLSSTIDQYGDTYNLGRWGMSDGKFSFRVTTGYETRISSDGALGDVETAVSYVRLSPLFPPGSIPADDWSRTIRIDSEGAYQYTRDTRISFGAGLADSRRQDSELMGLITTRVAQIDTAKAFVKVETQRDNKTSGFIQWYANYEQYDRPVVASVDSFENVIDAQYSFKPGPSHSMTIGASTKVTQIDVERNFVTDILATNSETEFSVGAFVIDRWQITDRLAVEGQIRGDYYDPLGFDWSGRLTALLGLDEQNHHVLRIGTAQSFRSPLYAVREMDSKRLQVPFPPGTNFLTTTTADDIDNERVTAMELGYSGRFNDGLMLRVDGYYQHYQGLIGGERLRDPLGIGRELIRIDNIGSGNSFGGETELTWTHKRGRLSVWYAYCDFSPETAGQNTRSFYGTYNKAGLTAKWDLGNGFTFTNALKYTDPVKSPTIGVVNPAKTRLDLALAKSLFEGHGEVMVGVNDIFDETRENAYEDGTFTGHETPGRSLFVRFQVQW